MKTFKPIISIAFCTAALAITVPANAGVRTVKVSIDDLDLARPSAQGKLQTRITRAVKSVCRSNDSRQISERVDVKRCEAQAKASADTQIADRVAEHKMQRNLAQRARVKVASD
jgi:UrcA family protein